MKQRFLLQIIAIILAMSLMAALTLTLMGKLETLVFWMIAGATFVVALLFYKK